MSWTYIATLGLLVLADTGEGKTLNLTEGAECKTVNGAAWSCKYFSECATLKEMVAQGSRDICGFQQGKLVICCMPRKSEQMCVEYAKSVFRKDIDANSGKVTFEDTCAPAEDALLRGGEYAAPREFPHQALVGNKNAKGELQWFCGGSLVSERFVLSAAHCTQGNGGVRYVRLGDHHMLSHADEAMGLSRPVDYEIIQTIDHPEYSGSFWHHNDISLYKLNKDVEFSDFIRPICLHTVYKLPKTNVFVTGFGVLSSYRSDQLPILQKANLTVRSKEICSETLGARYKDDIMMCASNPDLHSLRLVSGCMVDSGGPLQVRMTVPYCMYNLLGIVSLDGSRCKDPSFYTRVSYFLPWIESKVWP